MPERNDNDANIPAEKERGIVASTFWRLFDEPSYLTAFVAGLVYGQILFGFSHGGMGFSIFKVALLVFLVVFVVIGMAGWRWEWEMLRRYGWNYRRIWDDYPWMESIKRFAKVFLRILLFLPGIFLGMI